MGAGRISTEISRAAAIVTAVLLASGCRDRDRDRDPARDRGSIAVRTSSASTWSVVRSDGDAVLQHGDVFVYVSSESPAGLSFGDARGPRTGLISGAFAPLIAAPESDRAYSIEVDARGDRLRARFNAPGSERS